MTDQTKAACACTPAKGGCRCDNCTCRNCGGR
jgi:hypothetical protein